MLPDFPSVKGDLSAKLGLYLQERFRIHLGPVSGIRRVRVFEGTRQGIVRASGREDWTEFEEFSAQLTLSTGEISSLTLDSVLVKLDALAEEMAHKTARSMYRTIAGAVEEVGNVVSAGGQRLSAQHILDALAKLQIDFLRDGTPQMPEIHIHPDLAEALDLAIEEANRNPQLKRQFQAIMDEKREAWRAREASRRLVG
jgi:hypothetical protein